MVSEVETPGEVQTITPVYLTHLTPRPPDLTKN